MTMYDARPHAEEENTPNSSPGLTETKLDEILLSQDIEKLIRDFPDFSPMGVRIDEIISHEELEKYNPVAVVRVAAAYGFDIQVCNCRITHSRPLARANGKWVGMPDDLDWSRYDRVLCDHCNDERVKSGRVVQPMFKSVSYLS